MYDDILVEPDKRLMIIHVRKTKDFYGGDLYTWTLKKYLLDDKPILHLIIRAYNDEEMTTQAQLIKAVSEPNDRLLKDLIGRDIMSFRFINNKNVCAVGYRKPDNNDEGKEPLTSNNNKTIKLKKALSLNIPILNEKAFLKLLKEEKEK